MDKETHEVLRTLNFGEALRLYAHGVKELELYEPFEDIVSKGYATVKVSMDRGDVIVEKADVPSKENVELLEGRVKELEQTVKEQTKEIATLKKEAKHKTVEKIEKYESDIEAEMPILESKPKRRRKQP